MATKHAGAAVFIHLLDRYVNNAPNKRKIEQDFAAKLNFDQRKK